MPRGRFLSFLPAVLFAAGCSYLHGDDADEAACCCQSKPDAAKPATGGAPAAGTAAAPQTATAPAASAEDAADKFADVARQIETAKRKVERAQMDCGQQEQDGAAALKKAQDELQQANDALQHFQQIEKPARLAKADLDLKSSEDQMSEQKEEMQQLELMYEKDDLGDKTKEIVLIRGKRRLERATKYFELAKKDNDDVKSFQLPQQERKLALAVDEKKLDLARAEFGAKTGRMDKESALLAAQQEIEKLARELEKAKKAIDASKLSAEDRERLRALGYAGSK